MSLTLDPRTTALVLVDLQVGIVGMPLAPHGAGALLERSVALARRLQAAGGTIALVHVGFSPDMADAPIQAVDVPMTAPPGGRPPNWSDFAPEIAELAAQVIVRKRHWGAFHGTELDLQLRRRGISTIVLGGIATNFGVESTAREAWQHNYAVVLAEDATAGHTIDMHRFAVEKIFPRIARVRSTAEILAALPGA